jgi:hypothetical protein
MFNQGIPVSYFGSKSTFQILHAIFFSKCGNPFLDPIGFAWAGEVDPVALVYVGWVVSCLNFHVIMILNTLFPQAVQCTKKRWAKEAKMHPPNEEEKLHDYQTLWGQVESLQRHPEFKLFLQQMFQNLKAMGVRDISGSPL